MNSNQLAFLQKAQQAADTCGHVYPKMAAAEAALESGFGTSLLAIKDNNLFGMKQHKHPIYGTHNLPTREFVGTSKEQSMINSGQIAFDGKLDGWVTVIASWIQYPDWASCFADRMATLKRLASVYPHYQNALIAPDAITYIKEVSQTWSTDPQRAQKCITIYNSF